MKKVVLFILTLSAMLCLLAISISAAELANYCDVEITLVDSSKVTGYCSINYNNEVLRDTIYTTPDNSSAVIEWNNIKIFDMSNTTVVGKYSADQTRGTNCNAQAINVVEYYFPPQTKKVLNQSFTHEWKSLEKVYIPKNVKSLDGNACQGSCFGRG